MFYTDYSWQLLLISIFTFAIMFIIAKPWLTYANPQINNVSKGIVPFFLLYLSTCILAFWSEDTYHYWDKFLDLGHYSIFNLDAYEDVYKWLAEKSGGSYFLWRILVWLPACIFYFASAGKLGLLHRNMLVSMMLFGSMLSYTRGMLGHTMLLYGIILLIDKNNVVSTKIVGLILFACSYFFHGSMYVNIAFALFALFPIFSKSKVVIISLIAFPFLTITATRLIDYVSSGGLSLLDSEGGANSAMYANSTRLISNSLGKLSRFIECLPQYLTLWYLTDRIVFKNYFLKITKRQTFLFLYRLTYISIYVASLFAFADTSTWIYSRLKYMGFFPMVFVLARVWSIEQSTNKWIKSIIVLQALAFTFYMAYKLYSWY